MTAGRQARRTVAALALLTLTACATGSDTPPGVTWADPDSGGIGTVGALAEADVTQVVYRDTWQRETYARLAWSGGGGELVYIEANRTDEKAFDVAITPERAGRAFPATRALAPAERREGLTAAWGAKVFFQRLTRADASPDCIAFAAQWSKAPGDPKARPRRAAFGSLCPANAAWSDDDVALALRSIDLRRADWVPLPPIAGTELAALAYARGDGTQGQPDFPRRALVHRRRRRPKAVEKLGNPALLRRTRLPV